MTKENHSNNGKKIHKVRLLLDDPFNADFISTNDRYLSALQKRLTSPTSFQHDYIPSSSKDPTDLTPRVLVHEHKQKPQVSESSPKKPVQRMVYRIDIPQEDLFEIEKALESVPEFVEVKAKKTTKLESQKKPQFQIVETIDETELKQEEDLPKWEPVSDDEPIKEPSIEQPESHPEQKGDIQETPGTQPQPEIQDAFQPVRKTEKRTVKQKEGKSFAHDTFDEPEVWESIKEKKQNLTLKQKAEIFKQFASIKQVDQETALILNNHGITSIDTLYQTPLEKLETIKGLPITLIKHVEKQQKKTKSSQPKETKEIDNQASIFHYNHYTLYKKDIAIDEDKKRTVHFFSKEEPADGTATTLPNGYEVKVNRKTGVPFIKKIRDDDEG